MRNEKSVEPGEVVLKLDESTVGGTQRLPPLEHAEKGSLRSMWELIMQLRVLLPYLTRLVPLLDRGLLKSAPDLSEFRKELQAVHTGSLDLETRVKDQSLRLERMEEQLLYLRDRSEQIQMEDRQLSAALRSLVVWVRALAVLAALVSAALIVMTALLLAR